MAHRIWKETKLQPGTAGPGNMLGCCLVSFRFLWAILSTSTLKVEIRAKIKMCITSGSFHYAVSFRGHSHMGSKGGDECRREQHQGGIRVHRLPSRLAPRPPQAGHCQSHQSGWQFNRIFWPPNRPPKDGRRPKDERLRVGDELGNDLGHDLGGQKTYWIATQICDAKDDLSCVAVFVLSHGDERGYVNAFDVAYSLKLAVLEPLSRCRNLEGKAKMVFVQVCR